MKAKDPGNARDPADATNVSDHDTRWAKVPTAAATSPISKDALRLLIVLSSYANRSRHAWPSQETLARRMGWITESTVRPDRWRVANALRRLLAADLIRKVGRHPSGVRSWTTEYEVAPYGEDAYEGHAPSRAYLDPAMNISPPGAAYGGSPRAAHAPTE